MPENTFSDWNRLQQTLFPTLKSSTSSERKIASISENYLYQHLRRSTFRKYFSIYNIYSSHTFLFRSPKEFISLWRTVFFNALRFFDIIFRLRCLGQPLTIHERLFNPTSDISDDTFSNTNEGPACLRIILPSYILQFFDVILRPQYLQ